MTGKIQHRFLNESRSPIPMGGAATFACVCGRRGTRAAIERHIAESSGSDDSGVIDYAIEASLSNNADDDFGGGNTKAHYLPVEPRAPAPLFDVDVDVDTPTPSVSPPPPSISAEGSCPICRAGLQVADLPEIAAWTCGHWIRKRTQSIAASFQAMLRSAFEAGVTAAESGEAFESWYQREVLR